MNDLKIAMSYCRNFFSHEDIINELYNDNDLKKQYCLLELLQVKNQDEADILVFNLTQHTGLIRENASYKILELIKNEKFNHLFQTKNVMNKFLQSLTDINPSVCRNTVEILKYIDDCSYIYEHILNEMKKTLSEMINIKNNRSYEANKKNFNLYWNLEGIISISNKIQPNDTLINILKETAKSNDYTIREKSAKSARIFNLAEVLDILKNDDNFYVLRYINQENV